MRLLFLTAVLSFLADQASKIAIVHWMELARLRAIDVLPPVLNLRYGENRGVNFGLLGDAPEVMRWVLVVFSLVVVAAVTWWARRHRGDWRIMVSAGLLAGGALGNVLDRLVYGYVLDFLNMSCCGIDNPFVFNVADIFIFAGAAGLVLFEGRGAAKKKAP